jgi:hypothetical protein
MLSRIRRLFVKVDINNVNIRNNDYKLRMGDITMINCFLKQILDSIQLLLKNIH